MNARLRAETIDPTGRPVGPRLLVPGAVHWGWRQRERAFLLAGGYVSACVMAAAAWGTTFGLAMIAGAYVLHVLSMSDALRQALFPGLGRTAPTLLSASAAGMCLYVPTVLVASTLAWPGRSREDGRAYLVDRSAYRTGEPRRGDRVWIEKSESREGGAASVVLALAGEEIRWSDGRLQVGAGISGFRPFGASPGPERLVFSVPPGHLLVTAAPAGEDDDHWRLVPRDEVQGRAWATSRPLWNRRLLN